MPKIKLVSRYICCHTCGEVFYRFSYKQVLCKVCAIRYRNDKSRIQRAIKVVRKQLKRMHPDIIGIETPEAIELIDELNNLHKQERKCYG